MDDRGDKLMEEHRRQQCENAQGEVSGLTY
jgi:hypothetical protein